MRLWLALAGVLLAGSSVTAQVTSPTFIVPPTATATLASNSTSVPVPNYALPSEPVPSSKSQSGPIGVYENYSFQAYVGYTFLRFYEAPRMIQSRSGFDSALVYYFHSGTFGVDGSLMSAFGSQFGERSRFVFAGAGPRARWSAPRGLEVFGHGLVGGSHYTPQTAFGTQSAFAYEVGGGIDATAHRQRLAYRLELDMIGSHYFNTQQLSPKASIGIVWKF